MVRTLRLVVGIAVLAAAVAQAPAAAAAQLCGGEAVTIAGTSGNDRLVGTRGQDVIAGFQGDDIIEGLGGDDIICGGRGNDVIYGGQGFDVIFGAEGDDHIYSADGSTHTSRVDSKGMRAFGGKGNDVIHGSNRWDRLRGGPGKDQLLGYEGRDWIRGGPQSDVIDGGPGIDDLHGGDDNDAFVGTRGDLVRGGSGRQDSCHTTGKLSAKSVSCEIEAQPLDDCGATLDYRATIVDGWRVCIAGNLDRQDKQLTVDALSALDEDLKKTASVLPPRALEFVKTVPIWIGLDVPFRGGMYFASEEWLRQNGYPIEWNEGIHFGQVSHYVAWRSQQKAIVLHELAHAYHDQVLGGVEYPPVADSYVAAMDSGIYESVDHVVGRQLRAYATTNTAEYFAELTESLFWENEYYPFTRDQLEEHDPVGYKALDDAWTR